MSVYDCNIVMFIVFYIILCESDQTFEYYNVYCAVHYIFCIAKFYISTCVYCIGYMDFNFYTKKIFYHCHRIKYLQIFNSIFFRLKPPSGLLCCVRVPVPRFKFSKLSKFPVNVTFGTNC